MLEEKNDNLQEADGTQETTPQEVIQSENQEISTSATEKENVITLSEEELSNDAPVFFNENQSAINAIDEQNAEESEDETLKERHDIPMLDYATMSMEQLVDELEKLSTIEKVMSVKDHVEEIKKEFLSKYHHFIDEKKDEFHAENPETTEDFHYHLPLKTKFDQLYHQHREKKNAHFKLLQNNLSANLIKRQAIVEELKELIHSQENIKDILKQLNEIRDRWKNAGPIPRDKYNHVWNNYHFYIEKFYDFLHLDREARDLDFKHNLDQKLKIIARVEELVQEEDINKSFRELQELHRIWKEEIGPVDREHREEIWNKFSSLTKQMHDKREGLFEEIRAKEGANLAKKQSIIAGIEAIANENVTSHSQWQQQIEKINALRAEFFSAGRVSSEVNEDTWSAFKNAVRNFNSNKNSFYKDIKKDQNENLTRKMALVEKANSLKDSEDFVTSTPIMKQIQEEWKTIGHVPRKFSDSLWSEFREACNAYFEKLKANRSEASAEETEAFEKKKEYLEQLREFKLIGDHKTDLDAIKAHIEHWKTLGKVPVNKRHIEGKFNKILDVLFEKLSSSKKEGYMMRFNNRLEQLASGDDSRKIESEKIFIRKKIDELQSEIFQLENNIQFFSNGKNVKKENPMIIEVRKNIERHKEELNTWKEKLSQLRNLTQE
jgi:hypothetical protein